MENQLNLWQIEPEEVHEASIIPFNRNNEIVKKSNYLISAKYNCTLLDLQLITLALKNIKEKNGECYAYVTVREVKECTGKESDSIYNQIKKASLKLMTNIIAIEDPKKKTFCFRHLIRQTTYANGVLEVWFEKNVKDVIYDLAQNYTLMKLDVLFNFSDTISFRLYELLRSKCYHPKVLERDDNQFFCRMGVNELKVTLGGVNFAEEKVSALMNGVSEPDYDKIYDAAKEKKYRRWSDFKSDVLDVAIEEINERSDIYVSYELQKTGRGAKITYVDFFINLKEKENKVIPAEKVVEDNDLSLLDKLKEIESIMQGYNLSITDYIALDKAAEGDYDKIKNAREVLDHNLNVREPVPFMISAIKEGYKLNKTSPEMEKKRSSAFNNFKQRDYDYDELERRLLERNRS